jgi:mannose-6-phosphate isomerase-like protein (cupin superfamily)
MNLYVDIDNTICITPAEGNDKYERAVPLMERIADINRMYDEGKTITYWTARGQASKKDYTALTVKQLAGWGCKYHSLKMNKPSYDLFVDDKCCHSDSFWKKPLSEYQAQQAHGQTAKRAQMVQKGWGHEIVFVNNEKYCGKILHFHKGGKFSMHYHMQKQETWYVDSGVFMFHYIDTATATIVTQHLMVGDVITNQIGQPHQLICEEEGDIFEVSTTHHDSDSYRIFKGESQLNV